MQLSEGWPSLQRLFGSSEFDWFGGIAARYLNRFGHIQILVVAINAKLQRIFEMAIEYAEKHKTPRL